MKCYLELTSRCNLQCTMCFRNQWLHETQGDMSEALLNRVAESLRDSTFQTVVFGGMGEPLLHPQIVPLTEKLCALGKRVELLTNGTLLTPKRSEELLAAGLKMLWVSMDGFSRAAYGRMRLGGRYDRLCAHLEAFDALRRKTGAALGLTFVMTKENIGELGKINAFADRFHVDELNLSHMIPCAPLPKADALYFEALPTGRMKRVLPPYVCHPHDTCPFIEQEDVFVRWDGDVAPCMQLLHSGKTYLYELERTVTRHAFGNLQTQTLREIWDSPAYRQFRAHVKAFYFPNCTECLGCPDRAENRIDCLYNDFPTCGACLWATGKVFCP